MIADRGINFNTTMNNKSPTMPNTLFDDDDSKMDSELGMMEWMATEGGRKCPMCGRYAKTQELGNLSHNIQTHDRGRAHISMYGHLPGFGCNKPSNTKD
jgi:hypothetical protein